MPQAAPVLALLNRNNDHTKIHTFVMALTF
ncbi:Uncharacterised protein [Citrobacter werkmanii]|uniref:Uncharacterized protein n=1 Tax=Citrobacter werkmanii TaxID=67827 RepID=A0A9N8GY04_9ENTR|nr:Uncharacterised protein [Citrobacter werkmanii]CAB5598649.1 Uncharacterised protein [Citrobacter werkmanii]CAB5599496.1 Uncharacterised protein [Citrobacter werkmanii]CAB5613355.1 Uncharacterised protein [Citrobacter werkmanii]CAB5620615.1 Uncharacterised protein [Citrobacter werkmanii]